MLARTAVILAAVCACVLRAEDPNVPQRVAACLKSAEVPVQVDFRLNPFYIRADFDGDGKADYAVLVKKGKDRGIVVCRAAVAKGTVIGSGVPFNEWRDLDFSAWAAYEKRAAGSGVPRLLGEAIWLEWGERGSGLVYWNGHKFVWQQQGD
jgi:hypothetical protein